MSHIDRGLSKAAMALLRATRSQGRRVGVFPTQHAIERYQLHHPEAGASDVVIGVLSGIELERYEGLRLVARGRALADSNYVLAPDFRGMFVVMETYDNGGRQPAGVSVVTYTRLTQSEARAFRQRYERLMRGPYSARHISNYRAVEVATETK